MKSKLWIAGYFTLVVGVLAAIGISVVKVDPFFHYHKPNLEKYYYRLDNQRSQNDGISKNFTYDALITGTSMTENFKTSELDAIFGTNSIKIPFSGATYKEINDNLLKALSMNAELKTIVRGLDMNKFMEDKDAMRQDLGEYPTHLYDDNIFNDVKYIFNREIVFKRVYPMFLANKDKEFKPGITPFDVYSYWANDYVYGINAVNAAISNRISVQPAGEPIHLSDSEREIVLGTIRQNITSLAAQYPDVTFYYFFTPYSIVWWQSLVNDGTIYRQIEAEKLVIEEILKYSNIKLYSFNNLTEITTDINNYKDYIHYGPWVNSLILRYMRAEKCLLTDENYEQYQNDELTFYTSYDYTQLNEQVDYENDYYAEALLNEKINGITPLEFSERTLKQGELNRASIVLNQYAGTTGFECMGSLEREVGSEIPLSNYMKSKDYIGYKVAVDDISNYQYLVFWGMKNQDHGQPSVYIYDENGEVAAEFSASYQDLDNEWHQYMIDVSQLSGRATIIFNGGYVDNTGSADSLYTFSNIVLY